MGGAGGRGAFWGGGVPAVVHSRRWPDLRAQAARGVARAPRYLAADQPAAGTHQSHPVRTGHRLLYCAGAVLRFAVHAPPSSALLRAGASACAFASASPLIYICLCIAASLPLPTCTCSSASASTFLYLHLHLHLCICIYMSDSACAYVSSSRAVRSNLAVSALVNEMSALQLTASESDSFLSGLTEIQRCIEKGPALLAAIHRLANTLGELWVDHIEPLQAHSSPCAAALVVGRTAVESNKTHSCSPCMG